MSRKRRRKQRTLADYVGTAISPALIIGMVLSLSLFLLQMIYFGEFEGGFRWVLFWFVMASVLIARISIEQGSQVASVFGTALAIGTALVTMVFAPEAKSSINPVIVIWGLMIMIWWCCSKLTWDCTLIDDSQDSSGEGLVEASGLHNFEEDGEKEPAGPDEMTDGDVRVPIWKRILLNRAAKAGKPHSPGMWIVYVALVGLPVMGVGQRWLERDEQALGFILLFAFVASAMGLLLTTSFLGLRRYLRQRNLQMPGNVTRSWLITGTVVLLGILLGALLVPRPRASYSLDAVVKRTLGDKSSDELIAAVADPGLDIRGRSDNSGSAGKRLDQLAGRGTQDDGSQKGGSQKGGSQKGGSQKGGSQKGGSQKGGSQKGGSRKRGSKGGSKGGGSTDGGSGGEGGGASAAAPSPTSAAGPLDFLSFGGATLVIVIQVVSYLLFGVFVLYMLIKHGRMLWSALLELWSSLTGIFRRGGSMDAEDGPEDALEVAPRFADYSNPFSDGTALRASPTELVRLTFEALEAWARDAGQGRLPDQTPREFANGLSRAHQREAEPIRRLASDYARIAYGSRPPANEWREGLDRLWSWMITSHRSRQSGQPARSQDADHR